MKKIFFLNFFLSFFLNATITNFVITPSNFTVGDIVTISVTADQDGPISFFIANSNNLISPNTGNIIGGVYQGQHRIFKAGRDSVYVAGIPGNAYSNSFLANPKPPNRILLLFNTQSHLPGDSLNKGRGSINLPIFQVGQNVNFTIKLTDIYYNESSYSDTLNVNLYTDDPHATISNTISFLPGETSKTFSAVFRRATMPYQFTPSDKRILMGVPSNPNFRGDTVRFNTNSPYFHVQAGNYSKLLILENWDSSGIRISEQFDPGNSNSGKIQKLKPHPSGSNFWLEALACDYYYNRVVGNNLQVTLEFETPLPQGSSVTPNIINLNDGRDTFTMNISTSGLYSCYLNDSGNSIQSREELLDIRGSFYNITVDPDTILSCTQLFRFIVRYYDASGSQTNSNHKIFLTPVFSTNLNQRASGFLSDSQIQLNQGIVDIYLRYCTQASNEVIKIKVTDEIGTAPFYSEPIYVNSFVSMDDTFIVYPNPFGNVEYGGVKYEQLKIEFYLPEPSDVEVFIYDLFGHPVRKFKLLTLTSGKHVITWDGKNESGKKVASGAYVLILNAVKGARTVYKKRKTISVIW
ncbi:MAG: FlgD immunoglobulin-like domain containing protein [candidate division WOR-3 bacterium]